jgi:hypothetical protein
MGGGGPEKQSKERGFGENMEEEERTSGSLLVALQDYKYIFRSVEKRNIEKWL